MDNESNFYKDIIDNLYDGVYFVDRDRVITYWNKGAERITGYLSGQVVGRACRDNVLNHVTAEGVQLCEGKCPLSDCMEDGEPREADVFLHHAGGHRLPVLVRVAPLRDESGTIIGAVETFSSDLGTRTARRELRELRQSMQVDALTGIGSRRFLEGRLRAALAEMGDQAVATTTGLLFIDVDGFKLINDTCGHEAGDKVLQMVASTLKCNLRRSDVVGRWGGEEFVVIVYDISSLRVLSLVAEKLRALVMSSRLDLAEFCLTVTVSIGGTLLLPSDTPASVVQRADMLMYQSKRTGRNRVNLG